MAHNRTEKAFVTKGIIIFVNNLSFIKFDMETSKEEIVETFTTVIMVDYKT